ncbi:hypothetical protein ABER75_26225 [Niallia taxi]|uniref:hypothetical protein n=1 Tax=Niallia taxi TaxID=2499688 RepID=UPI003D27045E
MSNCTFIREDVEKLLINKGVSTSYIMRLKQRRVVHINRQLYDKFEIKLESKYAEIPVGKISSTHRIGKNSSSWWNNIFDTELHNVNIQKWNQFQILLTSINLEEFRTIFYNNVPPIEAVYYYPEYDLYEVIEGHHRTVWAILTEIEYIKVKKLYICEFNQNKYEARLQYLSRYKKLKSELNKKEKQLLSLIKTCGFTYSNNFISYKDENLFWFKKKENHNVHMDLDDTEKYIRHIDHTYESIAQLVKLHKKFKWIPFAVKKRIKNLTIYFDSDELKKLLTLYYKNWDI